MSNEYGVVTIRFAYWSCPTALVPSMPPATGRNSLTKPPDRGAGEHVTSIANESRHISIETWPNRGRHPTRPQDSVMSTIDIAYWPISSPQTPRPLDVAMIETSPKATVDTGSTIRRRRNEKRRCRSAFGTVRAD